MDEYTVKVYNGRTEWYQNNQLHREDGPAIEFINGDKCYYQNGKRHRLDGPAIEYNNGDKEYWINGKRLSEKEFFAKQNKIIDNNLTEDDVEKLIIQCWHTKGSEDFKRAHHNNKYIIESLHLLIKEAIKLYKNKQQHLKL